MAGKCYKCSHELTDPTVQFCPWCGAKFAAKDAHYMADGRTITREDENAYLSAPPPKYRRNRGKVIAGIVIIAAVIVAVLVMAGSSTDVEYDYEVTGSGPVIGGTTDYVKVHVELANVSGSSVDMGRLDLLLEIGDSLYSPINPPSGMIYKGYAYDGDVLFYIDPSDSGKPVSLTVKSEYNVKRDDSLI